MNLFLGQLKLILKKSRMAERKFSRDSGLSRLSLRKVLNSSSQLNLKTIEEVAHSLNQEVMLLTYPKESTPVNTVESISFKISQDGFETWKIHLMNMVDEFRKTLDMRLLMLGPSKDTHPKVKALVAATVTFLCCEVGTQAPPWAIEAQSLDEPWFVSGMESLKASALLESPFEFRSKNIFVHENFLSRA